MLRTYALPFSPSEVERLSTLCRPENPSLRIWSPVEMLAQRDGTAGFVFYTLGGSPLLSVADGRVRTVTPRPRDLTMPDHTPNVVLDLGEGITANYAHLIPEVMPGEQVVEGQRIGVQDPEYHPRIKDPIKHLHLWFRRIDGTEQLPLEVLLRPR